jgi:hypothetical protein
MTQQQCRQCGIVKLLDDFSKESTGRNERRGTCKKCTSAKRKALRYAQKEETIERVIPISKIMMPSLPGPVSKPSRLNIQRTSVPGIASRLPISLNPRVESLCVSIDFKEEQKVDHTICGNNTSVQVPVNTQTNGVLEESLAGVNISLEDKRIKVLASA